MERCTLSIITDVDVHALCVEVVDRQSLVALCSYMQNCRAELVLLVNVSMRCIN